MPDSGGSACSSPPNRLSPVLSGDLEQLWEKGLVIYVPNLSKSSLSHPLALIVAIGCFECRRFKFLNRASRAQLPKRSHRFLPQIVPIGPRNYPILCEGWG